LIGRTHRSNLVLAAAVAAILATITAAAAARTGSSVVRIGMVAPLTGPYVFVGAPEVQAARKAVQEINAQGGVEGHRLQLDVFDDGTDPAKSVAQTKKIVSDSQYAAMIGTGFATAALADEPVARGKILYLGMSASTSQVSPPQPGVYVVPPTSRLFAYRLGIYLRQAHLSRIALLHDNGAYPSEGIANVREFASKFGLQIVSDQEFSLTATDWTQELTAIKSSNAQAVWLWNLPQAVAITKQYRALGLTQQLVLSGGNATANYTKPACPAANGAYADSSLAEAAAYLPASNPARALALHVDKLMGAAGNQFFYDGYTGVQLVAQAIRQAGGGRTDRTTLLRQFDHFRHWEPEGLYVFDQARHAGLGLDSVVAEAIRNCKLVPLPGQAQFKKTRP
jgi:branched-chain amino acid transport system substrate-binding protein